MSLRWEDTRDILRQLESVYQSEDSDMVVAIAQQAADITVMIANQRDDVASTIRALSQQVYGEENAFGEADRLSKGTTAAVAVHKRAMAEIQGEISTTTSTIQALKAEEAKLSEKIASVAAEEKRTAIQIARADDARTATVPRVKHTVSLYQNISSIRWDTESARVTGAVIPPDGGPMKSFDIDPSKATEFQIANALWDLIAVATKTG